MAENCVSEAIRPQRTSSTYVILCFANFSVKPTTLEHSSRLFSRNQPTTKMFGCSQNADLRHVGCRGKYLRATYQMLSPNLNICAPSVKHSSQHLASCAREFHVLLGLLSALWGAEQKRAPTEHLKNTFARKADKVQFK